MQNDRAGLRGVSVFKQIKPLSCAEQYLAICHRYGQGGLGERRLDMGGHVIGPFCPVANKGHFGVITRRHETGEKFLQISPHIRVGIFLNGERARSMAHKTGEQPLFYPCRTHKILRLTGEVIETGTVGGDFEAGLHGFHIKVEIMGPETPPFEARLRVRQ